MEIEIAQDTREYTKIWWSCNLVAFLLFREQNKLLVCCKEGCEYEFRLRKSRHVLQYCLYETLEEAEQRRLLTEICDVAAFAGAADQEFQLKRSLGINKVEAPKLSKTMYSAYKTRISAYMFPRRGLSVPLYSGT